MNELDLQRYLAQTEVHLFTPTWLNSASGQGWLSIDSPNYTAMLAGSRRDVRQAQELRFKVFVEEYGAVFQTAAARIDEDEFDEYCDHIIVREKATGQVVGTYRVLLPELAKRIGGYYSGQEFFITRIGRLVPDLAELGRSCVHPDHRTGAVIMLLWTAIARYLERHSCRYLMGCVSVSMRDGGRLAASLWDRYKDSHRIDDMLEAFPKNRLPLDRIIRLENATEPPLMRAYLNIGAVICSEPSWDPDFNTADFLMLLDFAHMNPRYARHFGLKQPAIIGS